MAHPSSRSPALLLSFQRTASTLAVLAIACVFTACSSRSGELKTEPSYPQQKVQARSVDIQVFRDDTVIRFTNTTANAYPASTMWVNRWFSKPIPPLEIGQTMTLKLSEFKDQYGEEFRAGGFFASERPTKVVLVQMEVGEEMLGLVVVSPQE